jgi:hypothetical protein
MQYIVRGALVHGYVTDASTKPPTAATAEWANGDTLDTDAPEAAGMNVAGLVKDGVLLLPSEAKPVETQAELEAERARANDLEAQLNALRAQLEAAQPAATFQSGEEA